MAEKGKSTVKTVSFMMVITLVGKILGLVREQLLAANYGEGPQAVAFQAASQIPRTFFDAVFASAISASFIPIFNEYLEREGKEAAFRLSNQFITSIGIVTCILTALGMLFPEPLVWISANGFDPAIGSLCASLLRIMFPAVFFTGIAFSFVGILQSLDEFGIPAVMSVASNVVIIIYYIFLNERFGIYGLAIAFMIGWAMQAVIQVPALRKKGYRYKPCLDLKDEGMKKIGALMLPVMVSTWIQPINVVINTRFASHIFEKSAGVAIIGYANTLYSIVVGVFVLSIANVIFPRLSRLTANHEDKAVGETLSKTLRTMAFLLVPMMVGLMTLSRPIVRLMYERGEFGSFSTEMTARALFFFSLGMLGFGVQAILSRAYYAAQDGKTPFYSGLVSILVNIVLCSLLVEKMDVGGLALASALSSTVSALFLLVPMQRKNKGLISKGFLIDIVKMVMTAGIMAVVVVLLRNGLLHFLTDGLITRVFVVCVPAGVGVLIYMGLTYALQLEESLEVFSFAKKMTYKILKK